MVRRSCHSLDLPRTPCTIRRRSLSAFTLIELLVVISIISLVGLVFAGFISTSYGGTDTDAGIRQLDALIQRGRAGSLARNNRFEVLVDYRLNRLTLMERRAVGFFGFESAFGRYDLKLLLREDSALVRNWRPPSAPDPEGDPLAVPMGQLSTLKDGHALGILPGGSAEIPWKSRYTSSDQELGIAVSFDLNPSAFAGEMGTILSRGSQWNIRISDTERGFCKLAASIGGIDFISDVHIPASSWSSVELVVSTIAPRFYVNSIEIPPSTTVLPASPGDPTESLMIGGAGSLRFLMDNLRLEELNAGRVVELGNDVRLIPPGVRNTREEMIAVYDESVWEKEEYQSELNRPQRVQPAGTLDPLQSFPSTREIIYFNDRAELDLAFHPGAVTLHFIGEDGDEYEIKDATIGTLGTLTTKIIPMPPPEEEALGNMPAPDSSSEEDVSLPLQAAPWANAQQKARARASLNAQRPCTLARTQCCDARPAHQHSHPKLHASDQACQIAL